MQRQHRHLLVFSAIRSDFAPCANKNEVVSAVPVLDNIEALLNLTSQLEQPEIAAQEDRPTGLAQFDKRRQWVSGSTETETYSKDATVKKTRGAMDSAEKQSIRWSQKHLCTTYLFYTHPVLEWCR
jgi:hypothetical protein